MSTIVAISTAPGIGGIGIIRMSGKDSFKILEKIFIPKKKEEIANIKGYSIKYGNIVDNLNNKIIDEVLVSYFKAPKSYTTEDMCEISSHGGQVIMKQILEICLKNGAELAEPGEFTKRAFLNGRIDLSQAESVIDIINAKTSKEAEASLNQLNGFLNKEISKIKQKIYSIMVDIEASIDYPEYDIEEVSNLKALNILNDVKSDLIKLENSFSNGKIIKEGIKVAIIGRPNAGKSSLLNAILREERAIVTDIEGTTRDTIEESISIEGIPIKIIDTAGIRNAKDIVEKIGIDKSKEIAEKADLIIAIFDSTKELTSEDEEILKIIKDKISIVVLNKIDLKGKITRNNEKISKINKDIIEISALNNEGIDKIYEKISELFNLNKIKVDDSAIITNERHKNEITKSIKNIDKAIQTLNENLPMDVITVYIKETLENLGNITGESVSEDIINNIFAKFCLGK